MVKKSTFIWFSGALILLFHLGGVQAKRRQGKQVLVNLSFNLTRPAMFGNVLVPARPLHLILSKETFVFTDPKTMFLVSTVPVVTSKSPREFLDSPKLKKMERNGKVTLRLFHKDRIYTALGVSLKEGQKQKKGPKTASKKEGVDVVAQVTEHPEDAELIVGASGRYREGVIHCAENAFRFRWGTDHPKFKRCLCPITSSWRLPRLKTSIRVSIELERYRSGMSFTATPKGRVTECRVWRGRVAPEGEPPLLDKR